MARRTNYTPEDQAVLRILGQNLKRAREAAKMSQQQLGLDAQVNQGDVARIENGQRNVGILVLARLARAVGARPSELVDGID